jgi:ribosome-associated protein YbcJ (S4-like RNA binding protein)
MKKFLNIAVFGISLNVLDQLKSQILLAVPDQVMVRWVNIADKNIDLLMINDSFFSSLTIQKILSHIRVQYLRLIKLPEKQGMIVEDTLSYPVTKPDDLREWLQEKFFDYEPYDYLYLNPTSLETSISISKIIDECLFAQNGFIKLFNYRGFLALVDTMTERVWVNADHNLSFFDKSLNQTYAKNQFVQETIKNLDAQDLRSWLWHMGYHSNYLDLPDIGLDQYFKLEIWPKFESGYERRKLLKIASCFAQGAQIKSVIDQLNIPRQQVIRFVALAQMLKMGSWIDSDEAKFMRREQSLDESQMIKVRSFFKKLRKKLGI